MAELIGARLGSCVILRRLGGGGMGEIFLAEQPDLGRQVAVKVMRAQLGSETISQSATERFINEARAVAALEHPNILPIYEFGEHAGLNYLVMQYVPSGSLADLLAAGKDARFRLPMAPDLASDIITQAAAALQFAHDRHVVHLDVKPHNMLVRLLDAPTSDDQSASPHVLLADFGLARFFTGTPDRQLSGTPLYAPPEQYGGMPQPASDQYTLAGVAFELLTGRTVFTGTVQELQQQHMSATPPAATGVNPRLPRAVDAVLQRALAKQPAMRYDSIRAFTQALTQALTAPAQPSVVHPMQTSGPVVGQGHPSPLQMAGPPPLIPPVRPQPQSLPPPPVPMAPANPSAPMPGVPPTQAPVAPMMPPQMAWPQAPATPASPAPAAPWPQTIAASPPATPAANAWPVTTPQSAPPHWPMPGTSPIIGSTSPRSYPAQQQVAPGGQPHKHASAPVRLGDAAPTLGKRMPRRWDGRMPRGVMLALVGLAVAMALIVGGLFLYNALNTTTVIVKTVANPCTKVTAFAHAGAANAPATFKNVTFPANSLSVLGPLQSAPHGGFNEQLLAVCSPGISSLDAIKTFFAAALPAHGWQQSAVFPGNPDGTCGDAYCWQNTTTDYIGLYIDSQHGDGKVAVGNSTVILYHLQLIS